MKNTAFSHLPPTPVLGAGAGGSPRHQPAPADGYILTITTAQGQVNRKLSQE
ncbi:hypothetical protein H8B13_18660 [Hymenobacter sp. BT188]|uniref:hypothetical protein n=1 Tax=Hymenobacter sp. BT188 TaxID=2763504 RepID=UPI001651459F|nr:hypothetical protein [Hymenobacter sp. BT188]MBC6608852.1 hypothetical protein [Hymenobacter sp. BT188]